MKLILDESFIHGLHISMDNGEVIDPSTVEKLLADWLSFNKEVNSRVCESCGEEQTVGPLVRLCRQC